MKKTSEYIFLTLILIALFLSFSNETRAAPSNIKVGNILDRYADVPKSTDTASSKYAVIAKWKEGTTEAIYSGPKRKENYNGNFIIVEPKNSDKGKASMLYTKVASYKGRELDLKVTATDWEKAGFPSGEFFRFYDDAISFTQAGYEYVSLKFTYMYNDTGKPATDLTGSYMTINDLDMHQYMSFNPTMMNRIDKIYAYEDTLVSAWKTGNKTNIGANFHEDINPNDKRGFVTFLFDGHELEFDWSKDWSEPASNGVYYKFHIDIDWYENKRRQFFGYRAEKPVRTEILDASKKINRNLDENNVGPNDKFNYDIYHTVPSEYEEFYYNDYKIEDEIDESLEIEDVKVYNNSNENVSSQFNIQIENNKISAAAKKNSLIKESFYGQDYRLSISVKVKDTEDLFWITNGKHEYRINNEASVSIGRETKKTNIVTTIIEYNPEKLYTTRCYKDESNPIIKKASGLTQGSMVVTKGFLPTGAPNLINENKLRDEYTNKSHDMLKNPNQRPQKGWSESKLNNWIKEFESGSEQDLIVDNKYMKEAGEVIRTHGGVLNVRSTHNYSEIEIELCQKQRNTPNFKTQEWKYENYGGKEVYEVKNIEYTLPNRRKEDSYQILGVNCNVDGVDKLKNDFKTNYVIEDRSYDKNTGASRLIVVKPKYPEISFPLGKINHYTGKDNFYKPDGNEWKNSCQTDFIKACKSNVLSGSQIKNDANNNLREEGTFSHVELSGNDKIGNGFPNNNNEMMFFRDNKDRQVRADVWYIDKNDKTYSSDKNKAAKQTDLKVLSGTPEIEISTVEPWGNNSLAIKKMNEDLTIEDHVNKLNVKSKWSSKTNKPYRIGMVWTYEVKAKNAAVTEINGYDINTVQVNEHEFDASCSFRKEASSHEAVIPRNLFEDKNIDIRDKWNHSETMDIVFTRSTSDKVTKTK